MLFVFDGPAPRSFWMRGMRFCLDIVWIENGAIQGAAESVCPEPPGTADADLPSYVSPVPVTYVLEVPAGWLDHYGLGVGTPVEGLPDPLPTETTCGIRPVSGTGIAIFRHGPRRRARDADRLANRNTWMSCLPPLLG